MKTYSLTSESNITMVTFDSTPSFQELIEMLDYLAENNLYVKRLFDLTKVEFNLSSEEIISMAGHGKKIFTDKNKGAVVTNSDLVFGETRQLSVYREDEICMFNVFRDKQEAMSWLLDD